MHRLKALSNFRSFKDPKSVHDESILVGDLERFRGDLRRSSLGCKLLQQLEPISGHSVELQRQSVGLDDLEMLRSWRTRRTRADSVEIKVNYFNVRLR